MLEWAEPAGLGTTSRRQLHNIFITEEACDETAIGSGRDSLCGRRVAGCECRCSGADREECGRKESMGPNGRDRHAQYDERCVSPRCAQTGRRRQGLRSRRGNVHWHADLLCAVRGSQLSALNAPSPIQDTAKELLSYSGDGVSMYTHTGTHLDTLNHFGLRGKIWNQVDSHDAL